LVFSSITYSCTDSFFNKYLPEGSVVNARYTREQGRNSFCPHGAYSLVAEPLDKPKYATP